MSSVVIAASAVRDLDRLVAVLSLPNDTRSRVARVLQLLTRFPLLGGQLHGRWEEFRFLLGPWRWMIIVYHYDIELDRVAVVAVLDARASASPFTG